MAIALTSNNRYPGLRHFQVTESRLFFGRNKEIHELLNFIIAEQIVVLYSKSGVGKSSLIYAGLYPEFAKKQLFPIRIRLQQSKTLPGKHGLNSRLFGIDITPVDMFRSSLHDAIIGHSEVSIDEREIVFNGEKPRLWELIKVLRLPANAIPVFVFDQFEEFFNFPNKFRKDFIEQLAEILHSQPPNRVLDALAKVDADSRTKDQLEWVSQPKVKCLFAIRNDRISELDNLRPFIPLIMRNRYKLFALSPEAAREAMQKPGQINEKFDSSTFEFDKATLDLIIKKLSGNFVNQEEYNPDINGIDGSQLQKICSHIEKAVIAKNKDKVTVNKEIIKDEFAIERILEDYYFQQLDTVGTKEDVESVKKVIEEHFISHNSRTFVTEPQLMDFLQGNEDMINRLLEARLIKEETIHLGKGYELSHDSLIEPARKSREERKAREAIIAQAENEKKLEKAMNEKRNQLIIIIILIVLLAALATYDRI